MGILCPPGCVNRSRSVDLRELVAIFYFDCSRLKAAVPITLEPMSLTGPPPITVVRLTRLQSLARRLIACKKAFEIRWHLIVERKQYVAVGGRAWRRPRESPVSLLRPDPA